MPITCSPSRNEYLAKYGGNLWRENEPISLPHNAVAKDGTLKSAPGTHFEHGDSIAISGNLAGDILSSWILAKFAPSCLKTSFISMKEEKFDNERQFL